VNALNSVSALTFGLQAFVTLFVILDPIAATPIFLSLVAGRKRGEAIKLAWQGAASSMMIIVTFALFGQIILNYLHISLNALQGAGGFLLFLISMELLTGRGDGSGGADSEKVNVAMVPIGTPVLAGPGGIVTTMLYVHYAHSASHRLSLAAAIIAVHIAIGLLLMFSTGIIKLLGDSGITLIARVAGLLVAAMAVEMIVQSIRGFFGL
jgi:multiple antibiotic resistance protein